MIIVIVSLSTVTIDTSHTILYLASTTKTSENKKSALLARKALLLYHYVSDTSKTFDWSRENKINALQNRLA